MNWVKENKSLAGILGVMIVGALGLGAWVYLSYADYAASTEQWAQNDGAVANLKNKKVFPSKENADDRVTAVDEYAGKVDLLRSALLSEGVQQPILPMSQTEFQAKLKERATAVVQLAKGADIGLPADFALGFTEYTSSVPRSAEVAAELGVHLDVMERLVSTILKENVKSVDLFDRTKLPTETAPPPPKPAPAPKRGPARATNKKAKRTITEEEAAEPVLDRYPVKVAFTCDQRPLENILNTLCDPVKTPHFLVVRLLRIENERQDGPSRDEIARKKAPAMGFDSAPTDGSTGATGQAPKVQPDAITIAGEEKLKVYLEIDYIRFRAPASPEAAPATATAPKP